MLTKRTLISGISATALSSVIPLPLIGTDIRADAATGLPHLKTTQGQLDLDVSLGSLVGAALGSLIYLAYAKQAPADLIASFAKSIIDKASQSNLSRPVKHYIDYRVVDAGSDMVAANRKLALDMHKDTRAFETLSRTIVTQTKFIKNLKDDVNISIRSMREQLHAVRNELKLIRLERERSLNSTSMYDVTEDELRITKFDTRNKHKQGIRSARTASNNLNNYCRALEDEVLRAR